MVCMAHEVVWPSPVDIGTRCGIILLVGSKVGDGGWRRVVTGGVCDLSVAVLSQWRGEGEEAGSERRTCLESAGQTEWDREACCLADVIAICVELESDFCLSLMEMGRLVSEHAHKVVCCCPEGFFGRADVKTAADAYGFTLVNTSEELLSSARERLLAVQSVLTPQCAVC
jgi:hypothetical protein